MPHKEKILVIGANGQMHHQYNDDAENHAVPEAGIPGDVRFHVRVHDLGKLVACCSISP